MKRKLFTLLCLLALQLSAQNALNFDGVDDYVTSNFPGISGSSARTVEAWIRTTANSDSAQVVIVDWGTAATSSRFTFNLLTGGAIRLEVQGSGFTGTTAVNDGIWHHVAAVYNPVATNPVSLYVDGILDASGTLSVAVNTTAGNFAIGRRVDGNKYFDGDIDEVRVWNIARSASDIAGDKDE